jgi:hypothetical protein
MHRANCPAVPMPLRTRAVPDDPVEFIDPMDRK